MNIDLNSKNVLITGGTGSVGTSLIEKFSQSNGKVYFQYNRNNELSAYLEKEYGAVGYEINFNSEDPLPDKEFDIIVNNAGINITKTFSHGVEDQEWNETMNTNLFYPFKIVRKYLPYMIKNKWGRIINISSIYGLRSSEKNLSYNVSKHGLSGLTKTIAKEYASYGITSNEICPGPIESEMMLRIAKEKEMSEGIKAEEYLDSVRELVPAKCMAKPEDIAYLALFLSSEYAGYISGVSIPVDGALIS